ncbi:MAG TPA: hypothetical protein VKA65_14165 [Acidimicrobiales bacterium]|jgi:hypothetical protein|nr:hypothetical protein [Acidimicrobiales bacterium]
MDDAGTPAGAQVSRGGEATDEEVAAIVAAVEATWPRAVAATAPAPPQRWRFSGRWWTKPVPLRRSRPW